MKLNKILGLARGERLDSNLAKQNAEMKELERQNADFKQEIAQRNAESFKQQVWLFDRLKEQEQMLESLQELERLMDRRNEQQHAIPSSDDGRSGVVGGELSANKIDQKADESLDAKPTPTTTTPTTVPTPTTTPTTTTKMAEKPHDDPTKYSELSKGLQKLEEHSYYPYAAANFSTEIFQDTNKMCSFAPFPVSNAPRHRFKIENN
jgi:cell division septation protein DedD